MEKVPENLFKLASLNTFKLGSKIELLIQKFKDFREEISIINTIKFKSEIIKADSMGGMEALDNVIRALALEESPNDKLKYNKYERLDLSNLKALSLNEARICELPKWLNRMNSLASVHLEINQIDKIE
jgi:hypothetical protein